MNSQQNVSLVVAVAVRTETARTRATSCRNKCKFILVGVSQEIKSFVLNVL